MSLADPEVPRIELRPGYSISRLIKGGWQLASGHGTVNQERETILADMDRYVDTGMTTFDCADIYTGVEAMIGEYLGRVRERHGSVGVERVQVHTKFVPDVSQLATITAAEVEQAIDRSLRRLGVERLDLVQFHWWDYEVPRYVEVGMMLSRLVEQGKIRHVGATNFSCATLQELLDAGVPLVSHQVQYSLLDRRPAGEMTSLCRSRGVSLLCYGALAGGFLSHRYLGAPEPEPPFANRSLVKYQLIIEEFGGWNAFQELLQVLAGIANRLQVPIGAAAIRALLDRLQVGAVIVGARNSSYLGETLAALDCDLGPTEYSAIESVLRGSLGPVGDVYQLEREKGGRHANIMRYELNRERSEGPIEH